MENSKGYVYVMVNPAMNGVVKIGMTTKHPDERAKELSSATGVAMPYIVIYKREFQNCALAERLVHSILEEKGCRVNNNREFFQIDPTEAINLINSIPDNEPLATINNDADEEEEENLAKSYFEAGLDSLLGRNDTFIDKDEALSCFKKSESLGYHQALLQIGKIYKEYNDIKSAISYFKQGVKFDARCYAELGKIYMDEDSRAFNPQNAILAWNKYFEYIANLNVTDQITKWSWDELELGKDIYEYLSYYIEDEISDDIIEILKPVSSYIESEIVYKKEDSCAELIEEEILPMLIDDTDYKLKNFYEGKQLFKEGNDTDHEEELPLALSYYEKSADLGFLRAHITLSINSYKISQSEKLRFARNYKIENEWKKFYNQVYDSRDNLRPIEKREILEGFMDMFSFALENDKTDLLHPYFAYLAISLGLVEHYGMQIEYENKHINDAPLFMDMLDAVDEFTLELVKSAYKEAKFEKIRKLKDVHSYISGVIRDVQISGGRTQFFRLEEFEY